MSQDGNQVVIIGAGLAGLSAAYDLTERGFRVIVLETAKQVGGLASSILIDGVPIERYYHFICRGDSDLVNLVYELGIGDKLHWRHAKTSYLYHGNMYGFSTPFDLLGFEPIPFSQRIRFGLNVVRSRYRKEWRSLDKITAKSWLIDQVGPQAYEVIWDPLLRVKFGASHSKVSAAWIWHRVNRVANSRPRLWEPDSLGYLEHGTATIIGALLDKLQQSNACQVRTGVSVDRIAVEGARATGVFLSQTGEYIPSAFIVSTVALPTLLSFLPPQGDYTERLSSIEYLGVVCMLLQLDRQFTDSFWVNINDPRISFNGIIEYTNLNPRPDLGRSHFVYIPFYLQPRDERWAFEDDQLYVEYTTALKLLNPEFDASWVKNWWVSRDQYGQAVCTVGFADIVPNHETPLGGLYITDSTQYYPEDRTISAAIRLGRRVARLIIDQDDWRFDPPHVLPRCKGMRA
jgi:protoporphyrinogen oxidase